MTPWLLHQDEHWLAVAKPQGVNTHRPDARAQEGMVEWVRQRVPGRVDPLHRLDKETSGLLLLARTPEAHHTLGAALAEGGVEKRYLFLAAAGQRPARLHCDERIGKPRRGRGPPQEAETDFERLERAGPWELWEARPLTGRTHQIRVHAARLGLPIAGDSTYGGVGAARLFLHSAGFAAGSVRVERPLPAAFRAVLDGLPPHHPRVAAVAALEARLALLDPGETGAFVWADRHHDGFPGLRIERLGAIALALRFDERPDALPRDLVEALLATGLPDLPPPVAVVERPMPRGGRGAEPPGPPRVLAGSLPAERFTVREHGLELGVDLALGPTSTGLFLDQRETRRALLGMDLRGKRALNVFAHTGSLSVAAAKAGATVLTLDLGKRFLELAKENLARNGCDPSGHDFMYGDAIDWLRRFGKKQRTFDLVLLDPPSSSTTGKGERWSAERDLGRLVELGAALLAPAGTLYVSTNMRRMGWPRFLGHVEAGLAAAGRRGEIETATLPLDFRSGPEDPPYLKAAWCRIREP